MAEVALLTHLDDSGVMSGVTVLVFVEERCIDSRPVESRAESSSNCKACTLCTHNGDKYGSSLQKETWVSPQQDQEHLGRRAISKNPFKHALF